jgi:predicted aminopeptidase
LPSGFTRAGFFGAAAALALTGCAEMAYYRQAVSGQWELLKLRRPVNAVLADPSIPAGLSRQLTTAQELRDFASAELALPDNGSYRGYADLGRPYVVRNVFAAPELSLVPRQWCFPVAGCVSYRGYFDGAAAQALADRLRAQGDDVYVGSVPAYSTLGWFDDPLLNTFIHWPAGRLAELVFHELAHQRLYIDDDTVFNESFATAVGRIGARAWLEKQGTPEERASYEAYIRQREDFLNLVAETKEKLTRLYDSERGDEAKREGKRRLLTDLQRRYETLKTTRWDGFAGYDPWFYKDLNNAKFVAVNAYNHLAPAFEALFERQGRDFAAFYAAVENIGKLPRDERETELRRLVDRQPLSAQRDIRAP